ncbi:Uncharacterised protein [Mycobacteroides abscessus subsp. massiliense]|uniref:hypothetical protein n=1 Tax=Mycobacteroides abscessus TaxID=36809 RepID=UPI0009A66D90|nr:hypothetical protein [Mycobacteroides abscessus]SKE70641.1 Uncharacterised protein [Mycobacteroides abscessus subsp. massiliense]SKH80591.1 Uncharacterised protein [Mycobacteroides abscessus subsp. massiliense]SKI34246.1 Uncharacterised protein [Mycobacteroides abscessus subsp. massiliense]SKJ36818.1 Uncharacterised protein [Mycobacteroides abscessus subsp. massiliense]SKK23294.1 Uncharacterised protein [Mycobacteroides abscessus subsp. massiliense]
MTTSNDRIIAAADAVRTAHLEALRPLAQVAGRTVDDPPAVDAALAAALHLHVARPTLDHVITDMLRELITAGVHESKLARLMSVRRSSLDTRLDAPTPESPTTAEVHLGMFKPKDKLSVRAARESLIGAARDLGQVYAAALRPVSTVSQGIIPATATVDAALEAVLQLHGQRSALDAALDPVLAALVLGGVRRMSLAEALGVHATTLQRRLASEPLAHARHADLVDEGDGRWSVVRAEVGRYKPADPELDKALVEAAVAEAITEVVGVAPTRGAREESATVAESPSRF